MKDPKKWVDETVKAIGPEAVVRICTTTGKEFIGQDNATKNPHHVFYKNALAYVTKKYPIKKEE